LLRKCGLNAGHVNSVKEGVEGFSSYVAQRFRGVDVGEQRIRAGDALADGERTGGTSFRGTAPGQRNPRRRGIVAEELKRLGWKEANLKILCKHDPDKQEIGARLRRETTVAIKAIAARVSLGRSKAANAKLHRHMQQGANPRKAKPRQAGRRA
jgi:hypothetical protein